MNRHFSHVDLLIIAELKRTLDASEAENKLLRAILERNCIWECSECQKFDLPLSDCYICDADLCERCISKEHLVSCSYCATPVCEDCIRPNSPGLRTPVRRTLPCDRALN